MTVTDSSQGNAMTEIALAMAMGFFSVMVLTTMSMGVGSSVGRTVAAAKLAPGGDASAATITDKDIFIVYDGGRFLGRGLKPVDPSSLDTGRRIILALDPALPLAQVMTARSRIQSPRLLVTTLDENWRRALRGMNR